MERLEPLERTRLQHLARGEKPREASLSRVSYRRLLFLRTPEKHDCCDTARLAFARERERASHFVECASTVHLLDGRWTAHEVDDGRTTSERGRRALTPRSTIRAKRVIFFVLYS